MKGRSERTVSTTCSQRDRFAPICRQEACLGAACSCPAKWRFPSWKRLFDLVPVKRSSFRTSVCRHVVTARGFSDGTVVLAFSGDRRSLRKGADLASVPASLTVPNRPALNDRVSTGRALADAPFLNNAGPLNFPKPRTSLATGLVASPSNHGCRFRTPRLTHFNLLNMELAHG